MWTHTSVPCLSLSCVCVCVWRLAETFQENRQRFRLRTGRPLSVPVRPADGSEEEEGLMSGSHTPYADWMLCLDGAWRRGGSVSPLGQKHQNQSCLEATRELRRVSLEA